MKCTPLSYLVKGAIRSVAYEQKQGDVTCQLPS